MHVPNQSNDLRIEHVDLAAQEDSTKGRTHLEAGGNEIRVDVRRLFGSVAVANLAGFLFQLGSQFALLFLLFFVFGFVVVIIVFVRGRILVRVFVFCFVVVVPRFYRLVVVFVGVFFLRLLLVFFFVLAFFVVVVVVPGTTSHGKCVAVVPRMVQRRKDQG